MHKVKDADNFLLGKLMYLLSKGNEKCEDMAAELLAEHRIAALEEAAKVADEVADTDAGNAIRALASSGD